MPVGNTFTAHGVDESVRMSNGSTSVFFDVLALAGSAVAGSPWQQRLTLYFCDAERYGSGISGFDLAKLPWTAECGEEKDFFGQTLDRAIARHGWDKLHYDPPHVRGHLLAYRGMLAAFTPRPVTGSRMGDWTVPPKPYEVQVCARHGIFRGEYECRLCDVANQPVAAPKVWELISYQEADGGRITGREVLQIRESAVPDLQRLFDFGTLSPTAGDSADMEKMLSWRRVEPPMSGRVETILGAVLDPDLEHFLRIAVA
jgi:hypothetical protein